MVSVLFGSIRQRTGAALWRRPWLRGVLTLSPPLLWFLVIYLASLVTMLVTAFFSVDSLTGSVVYQWTWANFSQIFTQSVYGTIILRTLLMAVAVTVTRTFWDSIRELADRGRHEGRTVRRELIPFDPPLRLQFVRGTQTGTVWTLGYGPRMIGASSIDLQVEDPTVADVCFRLEPFSGGVLFKNEADARVNGRKVDTAELKPGDTIELVNTQILVVADEG